MSTRYQNLSGSDTCPYCEPGRSASSGLVHVTTRADGMREMGPCPHCEAGYRAESRTWPLGYWQGKPADLERPRPPIHLPRPRPEPYVNLLPGRESELSQSENAARSALLLRRFSGEDVDPCVGIDVLDGEARWSLVEAAR